MTAKKKAPAAITLTLTELRDLIVPVLPHADKGNTLPVLGCVEFRTEGRWLIATATDRYTIGVCRHLLPEPVEFYALVQAAELKAMLAMFKPARGSDHAVTLRLDDKRKMLDVAGASTLFAEASVSYNLYQGEYPKVLSIFKDSLHKSGPFEPTSLSPANLSKFTAAQRSPREPITLSGRSPNSVVFVRSGEHFLGGIMPVRGGGVTDWSELFPADAEEKAS